MESPERVVESSQALVLNTLREREDRVPLDSEVLVR